MCKGAPVSVHHLLILHFLMHVCHCKIICSLVFGGYFRFVLKHSYNQSHVTQNLCIIIIGRYILPVM